MTQTHKWNTADTITATRMAATVFLLFLPLNAFPFFAAYTLTGLTDVLDGWIARKTGKASQFGARLDSAADLMFYAVLLLRLFPALWQTLPVSIWYMAAVILMVRLTSYAAAAIRYHRFAALHTWLNKLTGGAVFFLPYVLATPVGVEYSWAICVLALAAAVEELAIHLCTNMYRADRKSILAVICE